MVSRWGGSLLVGLLALGCGANSKLQTPPVAESGNGGASAAQGTGGARGSDATGGSGGGPGSTVTGTRSGGGGSGAGAGSGSDSGSGGDGGSSGGAASGGDGGSGGGSGTGGDGGVGRSGGAGGSGGSRGSDGCTAGSALCGGVCTSLNSPYNCGGCGRVCTDSSICENGDCRSPTCEEIPCGLHIFDDPNRIICDDGCVECVDDADCVGPTRTRCSFGTCGECDPATGCPGGDVCTAGGYASPTRCAQCQSDTDCDGNPAGSICLPSFGECVQPCSEDLDCMGTAFPICAVALGHCIACQQDADCSPPTPRCLLYNNEANNRCVACRSDDDCALQLFTPHCRGTSCAQCAKDEHCTVPGFSICGHEGTCVGCRTDADCTEAAAPFCDPLTELCTGDCNATANGCRTGNETYGTCYPEGSCACETARDCPDPQRPRCDLNRHLCVAGTELFSFP